MAKVKTRLQYNSMGERVVVRTALDSIDAFATRSRQCSHPTNQQQQTPRQHDRDGVSTDHPGKTTEEQLPGTRLPKAAGDGAASVQAAAGKSDTGGVTWNPQNASSSGLGDKGPGDENDRLGEGDSHASGGLQAVSPPPHFPHTVSKSLGFGWPDFSSVGSKVGLHWMLAL